MNTLFRKLAASFHFALNIITGRFEIVTQSRIDFIAIAQVPRYNIIIVSIFQFCVYIVNQ